VQAHDQYEFERTTIPGADAGDFVIVNLFHGRIGAPMVPDEINDLITRLGRRAGLGRQVTPHQLRHAFGGNILDAGGTIDELQDLLLHGSIRSTQPYVHPDPGRLRAAVDRVPSPRPIEEPR
jgi:site-specific recombinase XerD